MLMAKESMDKERVKEGRISSSVYYLIGQHVAKVNGILYIHI